MTTTTPLPLPAWPASSGITFRRYGGLRDVAGMGEANARLRAHVGPLEPIDLDAMRHRYTHLVNCDPLVDCILAERDGITVGYGRVEWHDLNDGDRIYDITSVVEPSAWGLGIAEALVGWSEDRLREVAEANPTDRRSWFAVHVFDGDEEQERASLARGYTAVRWGAEMLRPDLEHVDEPRLPDGYVLRSPREEELPSVFQMQVEAFAEHWGQAQAD
ncbi:MAG TPA: GNAT family N-acetyltransferase, partial [Candidatus Limnocylindrales bacterium]